MKLILLTTDCGYDGTEVDGLFEITDDAYNEIQSLHTQITTLRHQWSEVAPRGGGTGITSWGGGPLPTPPKVSEEERERYRKRLEQARAFANQWRAVEDRVREIVQFGKAVPYEEIS